MNKEIKNSCINCKFFRQHYIIYKSSYIAINCGHCMKSKFTVKDGRKKFPNFVACELWETNEKREEEITEHINSVLKDMKRSLNEIAQILKGGS